MDMLHKAEEEQHFCEWKGEWDKHCVDDLVVCFDDFDAHVGRNTDGFDGVHRGYGVGQRDCETNVSSCSWRKNNCVKYIV